jgi:hypothetical protein
MPLNDMTLKQEKGTITLGYTLKQPGHVRVHVFNARGILAGEMYDGQALSGAHRFSWTAPVGGVYFLSVGLNGITVSSRMVIIPQ